MRTLRKLLIAALIAINCHTLPATSIEVGGSIITDTTWSADTVKVVSDIVIGQDATLNIEPGTRVEFQDFYSFDVEGSLLAIGEPGNMITFTVADTAGHYNNTHKGWAGLKFDFGDLNQNLADTSKLIYCIIEYSKNRGIEVSYFNKLHISNCIIRYNIGGLLFYCSECISINNIVYENKGVTKGGGYLFSRSYGIKIINNTIFNNQAVFGGGICIYDNIWQTIIKNTILWSNRASYKADQVYLDWAYSLFDYDPEFHYCNIEGGINGINSDEECFPFYPGMVVYNNNINMPPGFIDPAGCNFGLVESSYCINMGDTITDIYQFSEDIAGNPRIYDGEVNIIDIGAYEYQGDPVNRPPYITNTEDIQIFSNDTAKMTVEYFDPDIDDTHTISITTNSPYISINNLSGDTSGSTYQIFHLYNWRGVADIYVKVKASNGAKDIDTFSIEVTNHFCGHIIKDMTWDVDTVKITCNVEIDRNATLTIKPGTRIEFQDFVDFTIRGRLLAIGEQAKRITFTVADTTGYDNNPHEGWTGLTFDFKEGELIDDTSKLIYCIIEYSKYSGISGSENSNLFISDCIIRHNNRGGLDLCKNYCTSINNIIYENKTIFGGGGYYFSEPYNIKIINNTIFNNQAASGGGIHLDGYKDRFIVKNSIIWGNKASIAGDQVYLDLANSMDSKNPEFHYCGIEGGLDGFDIKEGPFTVDMMVYLNNINMPPRFVDQINGNFELTDSSYCINTGDPLTDITVFPFDISGFPRIYDGEVDIIDIGAYEFQGEPVNMKPLLDLVGDQYCLVSNSKTMSVDFRDDDIDDSHAITVTSDNSNVKIENLSGNTTGSTYQLVPEPGWEGEADIAIDIEDSYGHITSDTYHLTVSKAYCGNIYYDMTWDLDTVRIICDIKVNQGATLEINPGTVIEFQDFYRFDVEGGLLAIGEPDKPIVFTVADTTGYYNNTHPGWNGLTFIYNVLPENDSSRLDHCIIEYSKNRGIIVRASDKFLISNSIIRYNSNGGLLFQESKCISVNNIVYENKTISGGGGYRFSKPKETQIINNTILNNQAPNGGGIYIEYDISEHIIENTIIGGNSASNKGSQVYLYRVYSLAGYRPEFHYCNIEEGLDGFDSDDESFYPAMVEYHNNINLPSGFVDQTNGIFELTDSSKCINMGDPATDISQFPEDIAGNPRIFDDEVDIIDIGAYEYQGEPLNMPPLISQVKDTLIHWYDTLQMIVEYFDPDINEEYIISITADSPYLSINNLSGDSSGSTYEIIPAHNWIGNADIYVEVMDNHGAKDIDTFNLEVTNHFCGHITEDMVWDIDTVKITCQVVIDTGVRLTIKPGTVVEFQKFSYYYVMGQIHAIGEPDNPIVFTSSDTTGYYNNTHKGWGGITICERNEGINDTSKISYSVVEYVKHIADITKPDTRGAILIWPNAKAIITNCHIRYNYAPFYGAAGIGCISSQPIIKNNYIYDNRGAGIYCEGVKSYANLYNNIICNNEGSGVIFFKSRITLIYNNTICNNDQGVYSWDSHPIFINSIIRGNTENQIFLYYSQDSIPEFYNCNIEGGKEAFESDGSIIYYTFDYDTYHNIDATPYFIDEVNYDFRLTDSSYCINAGDPLTDISQFPEDMDGNPRIYDGTADIIDIGAYEYQGNPVNRPPYIKDTEDIQILCNNTAKMTVEYFDPDINNIHTILITADSPYVNINNLSGNTSGSIYEIIPAHNWRGNTDIYVEVMDNHGAKDIDTFNMEVTNHFCGHISEDMIWDIDTVKVDCDIVIDSNATVNIVPGTVVEFQGIYKLDVKGRLIAVGQSSDYITFTTCYTTGYFNNTHTGWGGIIFNNTCTNSDTSKLIFCNIEYAKNTLSYPDYYGGAIGIKNFSKLVISNCLIRYNYAEYGGGIAICNAQPIIKSNYILYNEGSAGAGIYINCYAKLQNNVICNNNGEGIYLSGASPEIINNTICYNNEGLSCGFGSNPVIKNSILWGNYLNQIFQYKFNNHPEIQYCDIQGGLDNIVNNSTIYVYENNLDMDPYFTDIDLLDYSLSDSSSCINGGTPDTTGLHLPASDIAGNPRILGGTIDIGAYESTVNFAPSDILLSGNRIDENVLPGSVVGFFSTIDANDADTHIYSFAAGNGTDDADNGNFIISADTLKICISTNYEGKNTFRIYVRTTDNGVNSLSCCKAFIILVNDINEPPAIEPQAFNIDENSPVATIVGTLTATEVDQAQILTYSILSGNTGNAFALDLLMGEISVNNSVVLDYETTPVIGLTVQVQDDGPGNLTDSTLVTINLNDVYEPVQLKNITFDIFKIYPNPARDYIYIEFSNEDYKKLLVEIKSVSGSLQYQLLVKEPSALRRIEIDLSGLPEGLYILNLSNNKVLITKKLEIIR